MICIYKITNPKAKIYIGQTVNFHVRKLNYLRCNCKNQIKLYNSISKYGIENHKIEIIIECEKKELNRLERYYQDLYLSTSQNGLNIRLTTTEDRSGTFSEASKLKMSLSKIGVKRSLDVCEAISKRMKETASKRDKSYYNNFKGKQASKEHKIKNSEAKKGNTFRIGSKHTIESKIKMSKSQTGSKKTQETKDKMRLSQIKAWEKRKCQ